MGNKCKHYQNNGTGPVLLIAEYPALVWARSTYADILDPELNKAFRAITCCLKATYVEDLYLLAGSSPSYTRRDVCARMERTDGTRDSFPVW